MRDRSPWLRLHAVLVFAFLYLPIAVLTIYSFNGTSVGGFPPHGWTPALVRHAFRRRRLAIVGGQQPARGRRCHAHRPAPRLPRRLGARSRILPGQGSVPAPGTAAADPAGHHHRPVAADALLTAHLNLSLWTIMLGPRHGADLSRHHGNLRGLAEIRSRAGRSFTGLGSQPVAHILARHGPKFAAFRSSARAS